MMIFPLQKIMGGCDSYKQKWHVHVFRFNCFSISSQLWFALRNSCVITIFYNPHLMLSKKIQYWTKAWNKRLEAPVIEDHIQRGLHYCPSLLTAPSLSCPLHFLASVCVNTDDHPNRVLSIVFVKPLLSNRTREGKKRMWCWWWADMSEGWMAALWSGSRGKCEGQLEKKQ